MKKVKLNADLYVGNEKLATVKEVAAVKNSIGKLKQTIVTDGDGSKFLSDDGAYKEITTTGTGVAIQGPKGDDGKSAYQIAVDNGYVGTESEWVTSLKGEKGDTGAQGPKGDKGADGTMSFTDLTEEQKESLRGPQGEQGPKGDKGDKGDTGSQGPQGLKGDKGTDGKSAYQIAVDNGYAGTESDWIASLKGDKGDTGAQGPQGIQGVQGPKGDKGDKGDTGAQGPQGIQGDAGNDGKSAYQIAADNGYTGTEDEFNNALVNIKEGGSKYKPDGTTITADDDGTMHAQTDPEQIKQNVKDYMTENPVSAEVGDKSVTEEKLSDDLLSLVKSEKIMYAETVEDIKALPIYDGAVVMTSGFYIPSDGGGSTYVIHKNPASNNLLKLINYSTIYESGTHKCIIRTNEHGKFILNGDPGNCNNVFSVLAEPIELTAGNTYTISVKYESGTIPTAQFFFTVEDGDARKAVFPQPSQLVNGMSGSWTATKNTKIYAIRFGSKVGVNLENTTINIQIEEGDTATEWSRAQYTPNGHNIIDLGNDFVAVYTPTSRRITLEQLGYNRNDKTQDCHDSIAQFKYICNSNNKEKYELFIPGGHWYFSETIVENGRTGLIIHGLINQAAEGGGTGESTIVPFNENQEYIWLFGKSETSTDIVGGYDIQNIRISSPKYLCKRGIWLNYCCYSNFDGLYFHDFKGAPFYMTVGWENKFGYLNFRGVGYRDKDKTYSALEFHPNPVKTVPSAISANYFDYFNFEGIGGNCFYFAPKCTAVHNEINNVQCEWSCYDAGYPSYIKGEKFEGETGYLWDDLSEDIEHTYFIKGEVGANYNSLCIKTASFSGAGEGCWTLGWDEEETSTNDDGSEVVNTVHKTRRIRKSGLVGQHERYHVEPDGKYYGPGIYFGQLSVIGDNDFPIYHSLAPQRSGCKVVVGSLDRANSTVPAKCFRHSYYSLPFENVEYYKMPKFIPGKNIINILKGTYTSNNNAKEVGYDADSWHPTKAVLRHGYVNIPLDAKKKITMRVKYNLTEEELQTNGNVSVYTECKSEKGLLGCEKLLDTTKADLRNGKYPVNEWFEKVIPNHFLPPCECVVELRFNAGNDLKGKVNLDCVIQSYEDRQYYAWELNHKVAKTSPVGTTAYCKDKRYSADNSYNGVNVTFNGKEWLSSSGVLLADLPNALFDVTQKLTNAISSKNDITSVEAWKSFTTTITAENGYTLDSVTCTMGGVDQTVTGGVINIAKVTDPVIITAVASIHHSVTNNLTNCINSNEATYAIEGKPYTATITANDGYTLDSVTCTMGGVNQTVNDGVINISSVTGDIVITATATPSQP